MITRAFEELRRSYEEIYDIVTGIKNFLLELYNEYKGVTPTVSNPTITNVVVEDAGLAMKMNRMEKSLKRKLLIEHATKISNEVDKYLSDPPIQIDVDEFLLLDWWKCNQGMYPVLSKLAKDILSIHSSTVASENAFSLGGRIVDPVRASLTPKTVEALVCTSDWLRAEEFNFYKEPTDEEVEFYKDLEELEPEDTTTTSTIASTS